MDFGKSPQKPPGTGDEDDEKDSFDDVIGNILKFSKSNHGSRLL